MKLATFFPYRLAVLADTVSRSMAQVYAERFDLSRDEWRVLAGLAERGPMKTTELIRHTTLDKMQVSRAVARMEGNGLLARETDPDDKRGQRLRLLPAGRALHRKIVPMVQAREAYLLEGLGAEQRALLEQAIDRVMERANQLAQQG
ncbi:MAG: MarR family transcriptional regulator [Burkholderiales bacterium]|nr:MarR family transcriptional regulator [Burkholderiales bacterium]